jgi:transposase
MTKNEQIKESIRQTREKRKTQVCKVYTVKFDKSHLSKDKLNFLNMLFLEAKWLYNYQISTNNIFNFNYKIKEVEAKNKEGNKVIKELKYLSSQMRQALIERTKQSVLALSRLKKAGNKIGRLKFKSKVYSIPLQQYGNTYKIQNKNYIKLQGYKTGFKVMGLRQIPKDVDIANANLVKRTGDFYLKITCFVPKEKRTQTGKMIGLDFGIKDNVTDSNGVKTSFQFPETKQLKKLSRKLHRAEPASKNRNKIKLKLQKQYELINNKKKDAKNKFIHKLTKENDLIAIQDESLSEWKNSRMNGFGRVIQYSIMGGIISGLKQKPETVIVPKYYPSTQLCYCGTKNKITLADRVYHCDNCGITEDRDIHSAKMILLEGIRISMERRNEMPMEGKPLYVEILDQHTSFLNEVGSHDDFSSW